MKKETEKSGAADEQTEQTGARPKGPLPKQKQRRVHQSGRKK